MNILSIYFHVLQPTSVTVSLRARKQYISGTCRTAQGNVVGGRGSARVASNARVQGPPEASDSSTLK